MLLTPTPAPMIPTGGTILAPGAPTARATESADRSRSATP